MFITHKNRVLIVRNNIIYFTNLFIIYHKTINFLGIEDDKFISEFIYIYIYIIYIYI